MKLDLLGKPGAVVYPIDYCPEISPEQAARLKDDDDNCLSLKNPPSFVQTFWILDDLMLRGEGEILDSFHLEEFESTLRLCAEKIASLTRIREALRRALPQTWPGTTSAEWRAFREAENAAKTPVRNS
jgi:hypothetical protein